MKKGGLLSITGHGISPIGIDIGSTSIQMAQLQKTAEGYGIRNVLKQEIPPSTGENGTGRREIVIHTIREMMKKGSFSGKSVVSVMPGYQMDIFPVKLSLSPGSSIEEAVLREAASRLSYDVEQAVIDYLPLADAGEDGDQEKTIQALLLATRREDVDEHLSILQGAKLTPLAIDIAACALARLVRASCSRKNANRLIINMGQLHTTLTLLWKDSVLLERYILWGRENMIENLTNTLRLSRDSADRLMDRVGLHTGEDTRLEQKKEMDHSSRVSDAVHEIVAPQLEKLAREIEKITQYFSSEMRGASIDTLSLTGMGSSIRDLDAYLMQRTGIPADYFHPFTVLKEGKSEFTDNGKDCDTAYSVALGLAMRGLEQQIICPQGAE
jgi:type IV pilus assembly protein PilM